VIVVPEATLVLTFTTNVKFAVVFAAIATVSVQVNVANEHVHPAGPTRDTAVVFPGSGSLNTGGFAGPGPPLVTVWV